MHRRNQRQSLPEAWDLEERAAVDAVAVEEGVECGGSRSDSRAMLKVRTGPPLHDFASLEITLRYRKMNEYVLS